MADGFNFEGSFKDNKMDGKGGTSIHEGMWKDGKKDGRGSILFSNGAVYEGRFRDDQIDGMGTLSMPYSVIMKNEESKNSTKENKRDDNRKGKNSHIGRMPQPRREDATLAASICEPPT